MKKFVSMILGVMMCLSLQSLSLKAYAPMIPNQDSQQIVQKYENQMFATRTSYIAERLDTTSSNWVYDKVMNSLFITDLEVSKKLFEIADSIQTDPIDLLVVMLAESGLNQYAVNDSSDATGFIQVTPMNAKSLGTSKEEILKMSALEQLDNVVLEYFRLHKKIGKVGNFRDLYLAVFWPAAVGKGPDYIICKEGSDEYEWNKNAVDRNNDGTILARELEAYGKSSLGI